MILREQNIGFSTVGKKDPPYRLVDLELAKADLLNAFMTHKGERVMRPDFGSIIHDLLFEPFDEDTKQAVTEDAINIIRQDPRFTAVSIDVNELEHTLRLDITLNYVPLDTISSMTVEFDRQNLEAL
jgi:phage baseplate assembly protein W